MSHLEMFYNEHDSFELKRWLDKKKIFFGFSYYKLILKLLKVYEIEYLGEPFNYTNTAIVSADKPLKLKFKIRKN